MFCYIHIQIGVNLVFFKIFSIIQLQLTFVMLILR